MENLIAEVNEKKLTALARARFSPQLHEAELRVIYDSVRPGPAHPRPNDCVETRHVRGEFLRWLPTDVKAAPLIDKDGLQIVAATIDGEVDLDSAQIPYNITFKKCIFTGDVHFAWASTHSVSIHDSELKTNLGFENAAVDGDISLTPGFQICGSIRMYGAQISGALTMDNAKLLGLRPKAQLSLDNAEIHDTVYFEGLDSACAVSMLNTKFDKGLIADGAKFGSTVTMTAVNINGNLSMSNIRSAGTVSMRYATVSGNVYLDGVVLNDRATSLWLQNANIGGDLYLSSNLKSGPPFRAAGSVNLLQSSIKGSLWVFDAELPELDLSGGQIGRDLFWARIRNPATTKLTLERANINRLRDVKESWPVYPNLNVTGLVYQDAALVVPDDAADGPYKIPYKGGMCPDDRIAWLELQSDENQSVSQPWQQLAQLVQARGNSDGARKVLYRMQRIQAKQDKLIGRGASLVFDVFDRAPRRVLFPITIFWLFGSLVFWRARRMKAMAPKDPAAAEHFSTAVDQPDGYLPFNPFIYALENVLPIVKLGQDDAWEPNPKTKPAPLDGWRRWIPRISYNWLAFLRWTLIGLGWGLAIILAGVIGDLFK